MDIEENETNNVSTPNECIVCVETEEKGKLFKYVHDCGTYLIHQKCFQEWIVKNGNECIICRKDAFTNEETLAFLSLLIILRDEIEEDSINIAYTEMISDNINDNQPNFGIIIDQTFENLNNRHILPIRRNINVNTRSSNRNPLCVIIGVIVLTTIFISLSLSF